jgi:hypothetical protein
LGLLAGKQGVRLIRKNDFFAFFRVLVVFSFSKLLSVSIFQRIQAPKKNRAGKPTVGFLFWAASVNMLA